MYSLVLATALTSGASAVDLGGCVFWCGPACPPPPPVVFVPACWGPPIYYWYAPAPPVVWFVSPPCPPHMPPADKPKDKKKDPKGKGPDKKGRDSKGGEEEESEARAPASVVIKAPMDVEVRFNGVVVRRKSEEESFQTPAITVGEGYHYTVTAIAVRDGKTVRQERVVSVRAGKKAEVDFREMASAE